MVIVIVSFSFCCSSFHKCKQWCVNPLLSTLNSMLIIISKKYNIMYSVQCTTGVNWDIYVPWKDKGLRATSFSQVLVLFNTDSVNDCIIECC